MKISEDGEELLESIWVFMEDQDIDLDSFEIRSFDLDKLKSEVSYNEKEVDELKNLNLLEFNDNEFSLTREGWEESKKVIRRHRLAEKLLHDVLGITGEDM